MARRRIHDDELHAQFVTFSCYRRRRLLDHPRTGQIVMSILAEELLSHGGTCCGFVVMPDHVHAIVWFPEPNRLSPFMQVWKSRSSRQAKEFVRGQLQKYTESFDPRGPFWQQKYYPVNLYTEKKAREKLDYMHLNPVRAGLVEDACDWRWSSARFYERGEPVGVPLGWVF
jgi:putative transposase